METRDSIILGPAVIGVSTRLPLGCSTLDALDFANNSCSLYSYLILAVVFGDRPEELHIDRTASLVFALFFIGISYLASIAIAYSQRKRKLFLLRSLFMSVASIFLHRSDSLTSLLGPFW
jgi:hypothetical protein